MKSSAYMVPFHHMNGTTTNCIPLIILDQSSPYSQEQSFTVHKALLSQICTTLSPTSYTQNKFSLPFILLQLYSQTPLTFANLDYFMHYSSYPQNWSPLYAKPLQTSTSFQKPYPTSSPVPLFPTSLTLTCLIHLHKLITPQPILPTLVLHLSSLLITPPLGFTTKYILQYSYAYL